ncbi:MAG: hypothetical protein LBM00_10045 [Deltaproteobacteria bacterium]|jgi:hypothetical protein|nr:hypothetical protein [Deltaproteobacteria bacterium]
MPTAPKKPTLPPGTSFASYVWNRAMETLKKNLRVYLVLSLLAVVPPILLLFTLPPSVTTMTVNSVLGWVLTALTQGIAAHAVYRSLTGKPVRLRDSIAYSMDILVPLAATSLLVGIGIGVGMFVFIVPGIALMCLWSVAMPVCVVERLSPLDCITRSTELTKGRRPGIFMLMAIIFIATAIAGAIIRHILLTTSPLFTVLFTGLAASFIKAFLSVLVATIYYELRADKEGLSIDSLDRRF